MKVKAYEIVQFWVQNFSANQKKKKCDKNQTFR